MASRPGRIKALIEKNIMDIVRGEIKDPKLGMVSVNEVAVNRDSSEVKVYVTFFNAKYPHQAFEILKKKEGFVRTSLAKKMDLYKVPKVVFVYDESFERADRIEKALKKEEADLKELEENQK